MDNNTQATPQKPATGQKTNLVQFPKPNPVKTPWVAEFEAHINLIEHLITTAKAKNEHLMQAFEQSAKKHACPTSLALANFARETDRHLSLAMQSAAGLLPPDSQGGE
jgi:hypothetical protein